MPRYFFDLRDGDELAVDEEGTELRDIQAVQAEAARALGDMARDEVRGELGSGAVQRMSIEVRDAAGPVLRVKFTFTFELVDRLNRFT